MVRRMRQTHSGITQRLHLACKLVSGHGCIFSVFMTVLLPHSHSLHAVVHLHKVARHDFSMGGTEQFSGSGQCEKDKSECVHVCVCVKGKLVRCVNCNWMKSVKKV